jgi:phage protein D/phage baseplate assembly protein gpV
MALLQSLIDVYVPAFEITVGNRKLETSIAKSIMEITVTEHSDGPSSFSFRLNDPQLTLIDEKKGPFTEGTRVEIDMGFVGKTRKMIVGEISALSADLPSSGPAVVEVHGFDFLHGLSRGTVYRQFGGETPDSGLPDSEIVSQIAAEMQLQAIVKKTPERTSPRIQNNKSNLAFLQELAQENDYFIKVDSGTIYFGNEPPKPPETIRLEWRKSLLNFSPRLSTAGLVNEVIVRGWDQIRKQRILVNLSRDSRGPASLSPTGLEQISRGSGGRSQRVIDVPVSSFLEAKAIAERTLRNQQVTAIAGSGTCLGNPAIRVGGKVELSGIGRFSGSYSISRVTHTLSEGGYLTSFEVNTDSATSGPDSLEALSSSSVREGRSAMSMVVIGLVLDNHDPSGLGRVKINLPGLSENESGHWARLATPMAGGDRGVFFLPEMDDEVLVAFEQGDITKPYVLGALWNGQDKPPTSNVDGRNNVRMIKSRSGHAVRFDDTLGAEKIEIIDKTGENSVTIDTQSNSVSIKSAQDVVIEAPQGKISLRAKSVEVKSTADTRVEAQTSMDLKASTTMTIKGQRVNIN